ncbi:MAG: hypothetical protein IT372_00160 [Polyangiaceae bacterium]|nr:hypothetical protein [Polyangiaceae bacterium]
MSFRNFLMAGTWAALLASLTAGSGCVVTEEEAPSGPNYPYPTEISFCTALAGVECSDDVVMACLGSDEASIEDDRPKCVDARMTACNPRNLKYNPAAAQGCLDARKAALEDAKLSRAEIEASDEACVEVFFADGASGSSCTANADCDTPSGLRCVIKPGQTAGTCVEPVSAAGGEKCDSPADVCMEGLYCNADAGDFCTVQPGAGETCSDAAPCADGFKCSASVDGVCTAQSGNGDPCTVDDDCSGGFCVQGSTGTLCASTYTLEFSSTTCDDFR